MTEVDWSGVRVLVTGGRGFLGGHLGTALRARGADVVAVGRTDADLCVPEEAVRLFSDVRPRVVVHAAAVGGGIGWMRAHPADAGVQGTLIAVNALEAARRAAVATFIGVSSACVYPRVPPVVPFREEHIWDGAPEPTNGPYGQAKRTMMTLGGAYHEQYGMHVVFPVPTNLYGPGDAVDPERAHVVAGLILRCLANPPELVVWGTGKATRELLYVEDAADGIVRMADWPSPDPVNLGTGEEIAVADLARRIAAACEYAGPIRFDSSKPDGVPRKCLDVTRARGGLGWTAQTNLDEGLARTVAWYRGLRG